MTEWLYEHRASLNVKPAIYLPSLGCKQQQLNEPRAHNLNLKIIGLKVSHNLYFSSQDSSGTFKFSGAAGKKCINSCM